MHDLTEYVNRYAGTDWLIVGKGPTRFRYPHLSEHEGPVVFLNDAVQFERHASNAAERFFFAHDRCQAVWLDDMASIPVLARSGAFDAGGKTEMLSWENAGTSREGVVYDWCGWHDWLTVERLSRYQLAEDGRLLLNCGTIHTAIHFAWMAGAASVTFVGCDGFEQTYDPRIQLDSRCVPGGVFAKIRRAQDRECEALGLQVRYVHEGHLAPRIPKVAHFVWLDAMPSWATENVEQFRALHPDWDVRLWDELPRDMPADLLKAAADAPQLCMASDILSYWLLHKYGGVYLDCDVVTLRPFDALLAYDGWAWRQHDDRVNCSAMGSVPGGEGMASVLEAVRGVLAQPGKRHRTAFGPTLLTELFGDEDQPPGFDILPQHYFGLFIDQKTAHPFWRADERERGKMIEAERPSVTDAVEPYSVHLWGVDGSSKRGRFGRGDALRYRLRALADGKEICGAEVGVLTGRLSSYMLKHVPEIERLYMVDAWAEVAPEHPYAVSGDTAAHQTQDQHEGNLRKALDNTAFASNRVTICRGDSAEKAETFPDASLDFVFIDADHTYEGVWRDLVSWWPKLRVGGMFSGHDIDNPVAGVDFSGKPHWGVRRALEEFVNAVCPDHPFEIGGEHTWYLTKPV